MTIITNFFVLIESIWKGSGEKTGESVPRDTQGWCEQRKSEFQWMISVCDTLLWNYVREYSNLADVSCSLAYVIIGI